MSVQACGLKLCTSFISVCHYHLARLETTGPQAERVGKVVWVFLGTRHPVTFPHSVDHRVFDSDALRKHSGKQDRSWTSDAVMA